VIEFQRLLNVRYLRLGHGYLRLSRLPAHADAHDSGEQTDYHDDDHYFDKRKS
jgi:hypothetical protein